MRKWRPFPLPDGSYSDETRPWSQQDVVNYLPTKAELPGARSGTKYVPVPGMTVFAKIGYGPYRGMRDVEGKLFVVAGNKLFRITTTGIAIPIGTIPGTARVSMTHNQVDGGNQLLIGTRDNSYLYDSTTDTLAATGIPLQSVDFLNQRFLGIDSQRRFWRYSDLADGSSDAWNTLNNESAESSPDRIVGGVVAAGYWWVFGERTIEVFANAPSGNTTFSRLVVIEKGCANAETIKRLNDTIIFLGSDFILYRMEGYNAIPISTKAQTEAFRQCDPAKALAYTYEDNGYLIYYLTFQDGQTWGYDVTNQRWHRRQSFGLNRWRINTLCKWNGDWYAGDYSNDTLYKLKWRYAYEAGDIFPRSIRSGVMHNGGNRMRVHGLKLLANTGLPESLPTDAPAQPDGPTITGTAPDGTVGVAYAGYTYTVTPGDAAIVSVTLRSGSLPPEITLSNAGVLDTGTPTTIANYSFTIRVVDANGLYADLSDSILVSGTEVLPPQLSDWRYLQIGRTDATDYSDPAFDDSGWDTGAAPFGDWGGTPSPADIANGATTALNSAHTYDSRFAAAFATEWTTWTRLWLRRTLTLASIPASDLTVTCYIEDNCHFYINGDLLITTPTNHYGGVGQQFTISTDSLIVGDNIIAIRCDDEAPSSSSATYADFIIEALP